MINKFRTILAILVISFWILASQPIVAQETVKPTEYDLLAPIPQLLNGNTSSSTDTATYVPGLVKLTIALAGMLAVVRIMYGGFLYISSDGFGNKSNAKGIIEGALWGLLLAVSAWLILNTIDPTGGLTKFNLNILERQGIRGDLPNTDEIPEVESPTQNIPCASCVTLAVPGKTAAQNGCLGTGICRVDSSLNASLILLNSNEPNLYVTEAYPPTVPHNDPCHSIGMCVDAKIENSNTPTPQEVKRFLQNAQEAGLGGTFFEALTTSRRNTLINGGVDPKKVIVTDGNGEHFHVKK